MSAFPLRRAWPVLVVAAAIGFGPRPDGAAAQSADCEALRQRMAALTQPDPTREERFDRAIQQQRGEIARTEAYSDSIGCGGLAGFFGNAPSQCDGIADRVARMRGNLDSLEAQARLLRNGDPDRMADLAARYDASCRARSDGDATLYADPGLMGSDGTANIIEDGDAQPAKGGSKAICVRTCDGGYFPLATSVGSGSLDGLQALCSAQCPNTEAKLYTTSDTDDIGHAVALDGTPYTALPAAFRFQKEHEATCTCKPPGQSWVQALAKAEDMLDKSDTHDVTVTERMSADMARPSQAPAPRPKKAGKRSGLDLPPPALPAAAPASVADGAALMAPPAGTTRAVRKVGPGL